MTKPTCSTCGRQLKVVHRTVNYPESGLSNVVLYNVPVWLCENGHEELELPAVDQLHDVLAGMVVRKNGPLVGSEVRFLRKRLGLVARKFAELIGVSPEQVSRLENRKAPLRRRVDLLIRLVAAQALADKHQVPFPRDLMPVIEQLERESDKSLQLTHIEDPPSSEPEWKELR